MVIALVRWGFSALFFCCLVSADDLAQIPSGEFKTKILVRGLCYASMEALGKRVRTKESVTAPIETLGPGELDRAKLLELAGRPLRFNLPNVAHGLQTVVGMETLDKDRQKLVRTLLDLSQKTKPTTDTTSETVEKWKDAVIEAVNALGRSVDQAKLIQALRLQLGVGTVEYAGWFIRLKSGRTLFAPFTSKQHDSVEPAHLVSAFNGVMKSVGVKWSELEVVDIFHTHPGASAIALVLSLGDQNLSESFRDVLDKNAPQVAHSIYAANQGPDGKVTVTSLTPTR